MPQKRFAKNCDSSSLSNMGPDAALLQDMLALAILLHLASYTCPCETVKLVEHELGSVRHLVVHLGGWSKCERAGFPMIWATERRTC